MLIVRFVTLPSHPGEAPERLAVALRRLERSSRSRVLLEHNPAVVAAVLELADESFHVERSVAEFAEHMTLERAHHLVFAPPHAANYARISVLDVHVLDAVSVRAEERHGIATAHGEVPDIQAQRHERRIGATRQISELTLRLDERTRFVVKDQRQA